MKLLAQSDDYGITRAVSCGILHGIECGIVRNTGLFSNMPWSAECVEMIRPYLDQIGFGIDLNASTGPSVLGYDQVPKLCHEDGSFFTSRENRALDTEENGFDHVDRDQLYAEFDAQIQRFVELVGKLPDYVHNHAYGTDTTLEVSRELAAKYERPWTTGIQEHAELKSAGMGWYGFGPAEEQLTSDLEAWLIDDKGELLASGREYGYLVCHCGYVDADLFALSSFNVCRVKDLEALCSPRVRQWVDDNGIELITFRDLGREWTER